MHGSWLRIVLALGLVGATFAAYLPVRHHEFVDLDDYAGILFNPDLQVASPWQAIQVAFTRPMITIWAPLTVLSLQLDRALYGAEPAGYLLTNVALHAVSALLLFHAFTRMTGSLWASAFVAAVFALHPLHVESVAWASERKDTLSAVFFALTLLAYHAYVLRPASRVRFAWVHICLAFGLLAKPMLVTLPGVLLLLDYWPLRRLDGRALREKLPMLALVFVVAFATWYVQGVYGAMSYGIGLPLSLRVANAIDATWLYLWQTVWPSGLAVFYPHPGASLGVARVALEALGLGALTWGAFRLRKRQPWWLVGWLWYLGMLVPVLGLVQVGMQGHADRYTYLPMIGIALAVAFGARSLATSRAARAALAGAATAALAAYAVASAAQVRVWRDSVALYRRAIEVSPEAWYPELRLGMVYAWRDELGPARQHLRRSVELEPGSAADIVSQLDSMARSHAEQGRPAEAVRTASFAITFAEETQQPERAAALRSELPALRASGSGSAAP